MRITVNGKSEELQNDMTVKELIILKKLNVNSVVIEINLNIIKKDTFSTSKICDGDTLEILHFVGGGK